MLLSAYLVIGQLEHLFTCLLVLCISSVNEYPYSIITLNYSVSAIYPSEDRDWILIDIHEIKTVSLVSTCTLNHWELPYRIKIIHLTDLISSGLCRLWSKILSILLIVRLQIDGKHESAAILYWLGAIVLDLQVTSGNVYVEETGSGSGDTGWALIPETPLGAGVTMSKRFTLE